MPVERIGTDNVDLLTVRAAELDGSIIDGRGGEDILELAAGSFGVFDFRSVASFAGIERIRGIGSSQSVIFSSDQISGITSFENPNGGYFDLKLEGANIDFRDKALVGDNVSVIIGTDAATFAVNDLQVALAVDGSHVLSETLVVEGIVLTAAERRTLHSHGIDRVQDASGAITEDLTGPTISGLNSRLGVSPGFQESPFIHATLGEDMGLYFMSIEIDSHWSQERLDIDQSGSIRIEFDEWVHRITVNGRFVAETYLTSTRSLRFYFTTEATVSDAQEILRSIIYKSDGSDLPARPNKLKVELTDWFQNRAYAEVGIDYLNLAPTTLRLDSEIIYLDDKGGWRSSLFATDPNIQESFTFTLINNPNGQFIIHQYEFGATLISAKTYAGQQSFTVTIRVTDRGGLSFDQTFVLPVVRSDVVIDPDDILYDEIIQGTDADNIYVGSERGDKILGYNGNDRLEGKGGSDALYGGLGRDTLIGGEEVDNFVFNTKVAAKKNKNIDKILDFKPSFDVIVLDKNIFKKLPNAEYLNKGAYWLGSKAHDSNDRIIYDKKTGNLWYDPDGSGKQTAIKIAILSSKLKITHDDFYVTGL